MISAAIAYLAIGTGGALCIVRLLRGPSLADRMVALDTLVVIVVAAVVVGAARSRSGVFLDVVVATALLGFVSTLAVARYLENEEHQ